MIHFFDQNVIETFIDKIWITFNIPYIMSIINLLQKIIKPFNISRENIT